MGVRPIAWREMVKRLRAHGWDGPYYKGPHPFMKKGKRKLPIPNNHGGMVNDPSLLGRVVAKAGISDTDWEDT